MMPTPVRLEIFASVVCWLQEVPVRRPTSDSDSERVCPKEGVKTQHQQVSSGRLMVFSLKCFVHTLSIDHRSSIHPVFKKGWDSTVVQMRLRKTAGLVSVPRSSSYCKKWVSMMDGWPAMVPHVLKAWRCRIPQPLLGSLWVKTLV